MLGFIVIISKSLCNRWNIKKIANFPDIEIITISILG